VRETSFWVLLTAAGWPTVTKGASARFYGFRNLGTDTGRIGRWIQLGGDGAARTRARSDPKFPEAELAAPESAEGGQQEVGGGQRLASEAAT